jgi:hypothetical protein
MQPHTNFQFTFAGFPCLVTASGHPAGRPAPTPEGFYELIIQSF